MDAEFEKPAARFRLGCWFEQDGRSAEALLHFRRLRSVTLTWLLIRPFNLVSYCCVSGYGDIQMPLAVFNALLNLDHRIRMRSTPLHWLSLAQNASDDGIAAFRRVTELQPNNVSGYTGLGLAFEMNKQHVEAIDA
jgi:hypothetical protein